MSPESGEREALRREVIEELRASGMQYEVMDFAYVTLGEVRPGEAHPTGEVSPEHLEMLKASAPAVFSRREDKCPLCAFSCRSRDYVLADRPTRRVYTYTDVLFHLVEEHRFLPPAAFLEALERQYKNPRPGPAIDHSSCV